MDIQKTSLPNTHLKRNRWVLAIAIISIATLLVGISIAASALSRNHHSSQAAPPPGHWVQVLNGFSVDAPVAAPSDRAVLYACASHRTLGTPTSTRVPVAIYTVLRSNDFGTHWQNVGEKLNLVVLCNIAIDPRDANNLYVAGESTNFPPPDGQRMGVLMHSTDGGESWSVIHPMLKRAGEASAEPWYAEEVKLAGNSFFGLTFQTGDGLASSADGGRNWNVPQGHFSNPQQGIYSYAVDPAHPGTIYELVDNFWSAAPSLNSVELYKTSDGGTTWQRLRNDVPLGNQVYLASDKPQIVYMIGALGPLHLSTSGPPRAHPQQRIGFNLQVSTDAGTSWRDVLIPEQLSEAEHWAVAPDGRVYAYDGECTSESSVQPAATPGVHCTSALESYDPLTNKWTQLPSPPAQGIFLGATPTGPASATAVWFMGRTNEEVTLYRYVA
jgi:hypothetical protein